VSEPFKPEDDEDGMEAMGTLIGIFLVAILALIFA
jgi:hypothetical protein